MDTTQSGEISVIEPIGEAIEKTKQILFRPFDIGKWFAIGFCAWLATLGNGGGGGFNFGGPGNRSGGTAHDFRQEINNAKDAILENLPVVISVAAVVIVLILALTLVLMWLKSRGQFMFLDSVACDTGEIVRPWKQYAQQGNSLFLFNVLLGLAGLLGAMMFVVPLTLIGISFMRVGIECFPIANLVWVFLLIFGIIMMAMTIGCIKLLTTDFVVPIMYRHGCLIREGWSIVWQLLKTNMGPFTIYLLFLIVIGLAIGMIVLLAIAVTCCCAACILAIPYLGTVLMLPLLVWRRAYSLCYLRQYGPEYDVFVRATTPVVVPTGVIPPESPEQNF